MIRTSTTATRRRLRRVVSAAAVSLLFYAALIGALLIHWPDTAIGHIITILCAAFACLWSMTVGVRSANLTNDYAPALAAAAALRNDCEDAGIYTPDRWPVPLSPGARAAVARLTATDRAEEIEAVAATLYNATDRARSACSPATWTDMQHHDSARHWRDAAALAIDNLDALRRTRTAAVL